MNKKYNIKYNAIPEQNLRFANQLTVHQWNEIINILRVQTNLSSEYIEKLHLWLIGTNPYATLPEPDELEYDGTVIKYDGIIEYIFKYLDLNTKLIEDNKAALNTFINETYNKHVEDFEEHTAEFINFKTVYYNHVRAFEAHTAEFAEHIEEFETHVVAYNSLETRVTNTESAISGLDRRLDTAENTIDKLPDTYVPKDWSNYETHDQYVDENAKFIIKIDGKEYTTTMKYLKDVFLEHTESHYRGNFTSYESLISTTFEPQLVAGDYAFVSEDSKDPNFVTKVLVMYIWDDTKHIWTSSGTGQYASYASLTKLKQDLSSGATTVGSAMTAHQYIDAEGNTKNISETFEEHTVSLTINTDPYEDTEHTMRGIEINGEKFNIPSADIALRDFVSPSTTKQLKEIIINGTAWKVSPDINLDDIPSSGITDVEQLPNPNWRGTPVPGNGLIEKLYFNTKLGVDEVNAIIDSLQFTTSNILPLPAVIVAVPEGFARSVVIIGKSDLNDSSKRERLILCMYPTESGEFEWDTIYQYNDIPGEENYTGWTTYTELELNYDTILNLAGIELGYTNQNEQLIKLVSITPHIPPETPEENTLYRTNTDNKPLLHYYKNGVYHTLSQDLNIIDLQSLPASTFKGTPIPYLDNVDTVYFNTNATQAEVVSTVKKLFTQAGLTPEQMYTPIYISPTISLHIYLYSTNDVLILADITGLTSDGTVSMPAIFITPALATQIGATKYGWVYEGSYIKMQGYNKPTDDYLVGVHNDLISNLLSSTPFEEIVAPGESQSIYRVFNSGDVIGGTLVPYEGYISLGASTIDTTVPTEDVTNALASLTYKYDDTTNIGLYYVVYVDILGTQAPLLTVKHNKDTNIYTITFVDTPIFSSHDDPDNNISAGWDKDTLNSIYAESADMLNMEFEIITGIVLDSMGIPRMNDKLNKFIYTAPYTYANTKYDLYYYKDGWHKITPDYPIASVKPTARIEYRDVSNNPEYASYLPDLEADRVETGKDYLAIRDFICTITIPLDDKLASIIKKEGAYLYLYKRTTRKYRNGSKGWKHPKQGNYGTGSKSCLDGFKKTVNGYGLGEDENYIVQTEIPVEVVMINGKPFIKYECSLIYEIAKKAAFTYYVEDNEEPFGISLSRFSVLLNTDTWQLFLEGSDVMNKNIIVLGTKACNLDIRYSLVVPGLGESLHSDTIRLVYASDDTHKRFRVVPYIS